VSGNKVNFASKAIDSASIIVYDGKRKLLDSCRTYYKGTSVMRILVATRERAVFDVFNDVEGSMDTEVIPILDTGQIYETIPEVQVAVVDYGDLIEDPFSIECVRRLLSEAPIEHYTSGEFLASPEACLRQATPAGGQPFELPSKRTIAFTSYSGGTGKTSLALDTALRFASQTEARLPLPAAVVEFTYGASALKALVAEDQVTLDQLVLQPELRPYEFRGVTLYPMDYDPIRELSVEQIRRCLHQQISSHVLTVIDTIWPHGLASAIGEEVDLWIVLGTPRIDAMENARLLYRELGARYGEQKTLLAINKMSGLGASLALMGMHRDLELPVIQNAELFFEGRLGREVLDSVYGSLWREYERAGRRRWRLFAGR
jgi:hypothetical protein